MVVALAVVAFLVAMIVINIFGPSKLASRVDALDQAQKDEALRGVPRATRPSFPLAVAVIAATSAITTHLLERTGAEWWVLACVLSLVLLTSQRRNRPLLERVLLDAGARPPSVDVVDHERTQRRWSYAGTVLFTAGTCCQVLARLGGAAWLVVPGAVLVVLSFVLLLVLGWKLMRGPDPQPIVLWHRGG